MRMCLYLCLLKTVQELTSLKVGDSVRVKPTVITPKYKWGSVTRNSIGIVTGEMAETRLL